MTRARSDQALPADVVIDLGGGALVDPKCLWCGKHFRPRRDGGKAQRFCSAACRGAFYAACRTWAARATDKTAKLVRKIDVPAKYVTNVNFGPTVSTLYITAAIDANNSPYPGEVYEITP